MRCQEWFRVRRIGMLALCLGLLCISATSSLATPWYAYNLLTYVPASPRVNAAVTYNWSAVNAQITSVTPGTWTLTNCTLGITGPNSYSSIRNGTVSCGEPWYFPALGIYNATLTLTYRTPTQVVDPSGGLASYTHTCIAPAVTYVALTPLSVSTAKRQHDGAFVHLRQKVVTYVGPSFLYVEDDNRSCGIRVNIGSEVVTVGMRVDVIGIAETDGIERVINADTTVQNGDGSVSALAMPNKSIGGGNWFYNAINGAGQRRVESGVGLNNIGLLVKTTGRVVSSSMGGICHINDGSGGDLRVEVLGVPGTTSKPAQVNESIQVTGISGVTHDHTRVLLARSSADLVVEQAPAVYLYRTNLATAQQFQTLLGANKIKVDLVHMSAAEFVDYDGKYSLIIIGWDTNTGTDWGNDEIVLSVGDANCHVLGIETGGAMCFGKLLLWMGQPRVSYYQGNAMTATDTASPIYHTPYTIPINIVTGTIGISTSASGWYGTSYLNPIPGIVVPFGKKVGTTNNIMLAWEASRYMYWPFRDAPDLLTDAGRKLFVNAAWYAMQQP